MRIVRLYTTTPSENGEFLRKCCLNHKIVHCGIADFPPGIHAHNGELHVHENDEIFFILNGEISVPIADNPVEIARTGDWVLVEAGEEHHLTNHTCLPCTAAYIILQQ